MASNSNVNNVGNKYNAYNEQLGGELRLGDRLEFNRGMYAHWGIHVGEYEGMKHAVIHFGMLEGGSKFSGFKSTGKAFAANEKPEILASTIDEILGNKGSVRINNSSDCNRQFFSSEAISERAKKMHRDRIRIDYNLFKMNCEHFVNFCRYDDPHSAQITAPMQITVLLGLIGAIFVFAVLISPDARRR